MIRLALLAQLAAQPLPEPSAIPAWNPTAPYVVSGQDEYGYRYWLATNRMRPVYVTSFQNYLIGAGVAGIIPTWQLLRTASNWYKCGAPPFEVPPSSEWPNIVQTLRYVHAHVIPVVGPVEAVSVYRNPSLNICSGGALESAHRSAQAIDLVPLRPISREALVHMLCLRHGDHGGPYHAGLGFYPWLRFHIDTRRFRTWGFDHRNATVCARPRLLRDPPVIASPQQPAGPGRALTAQAPAAAPAAVSTPASTSAPDSGVDADPLAPLAE